ncbi:MAG: DUF4499 domain-containing protein [Deltaproteobacteria bacterium]|nr:MAG: DUF4499 domain-containing protein [Deltaproteobacteria bacterium]
MFQSIPRPHWGWWLTLDGGLLFLGVLTFSPTAYKWWSQTVTTLFSPTFLLWLFVAAVMAHVVEAVVAWRWCREANISETWAWTFQTFLLGFPSLGLLRRTLQERNEPSKRN